MDFADATLVHLAGRLSLATIFTIDNNDHPEYGGLELALKDFARLEKTSDDNSVLQPKKVAAAL